MNTIPEVAALEHLLVHGPSKVAVLMKAVSLSETSTRKLMKRLEDEGKVVKNGQFFELKERKIDAPKAGESKRADITARDVDVLAYIEKHASNDGETVSRDEIAKALKLSGSLAYLSIYRLHQRGDIERVHVGKRAPEWRIAYHRD